MTPKFRGNSDDWLDEKDGRDSSGSGMRPKKSKRASARSTGLDPSQANGTVAEVFPNCCRVRLDQDQSEVLCHYKRSEVIGLTQEQIRERSPVAVGDRVQVESSGNRVIGICSRKNFISRSAPGREARGALQDSVQIQHVIAANLDLLVIVVSIHEPDFSIGIVDRFLVAAEAQKIPAMICITKMDLRTPESNESKPWAVYDDLGYPSIEVSVVQGEGVDFLKHQLLGKVVLFAGHSGVGKTSLLRALLGTSVGKVGAVNVATGKGKHTTTAAVLLEGPQNSRWIDTPGVKEFGLMGVLPENLSQHFPEFRELPCRSNSCQHLDESHCEARGLKRYASYRRILLSLLELESS